MKILLVFVWKLIKALVLILLIWSPIFIPIVGVGLIIGLLWYVLWKDQKGRLDEKGAWDLIMDFEKSRDVALRSEAKVAVQMLEAIAHHTPKLAGSYHSMMAERERARDVHEIIEHLRKITGQDLGEDPQRWIDQYGASPQPGVVSSTGR